MKLWLLHMLAIALGLSVRVDGAAYGRAPSFAPAAMRLGDCSKPPQPFRL